jgi:hypothetical protein
MPANIPLSSVTAPGTYIFEQSGGFTPVAIAQFYTTYMIGTASQGEDFELTQVVNYEDFINVFFASPCEAAVKLWFANAKTYGALYFIKVPDNTDASFFEGLELLASDENLPLGFILLPEVGELADINSIQNIYNKARDIAEITDFVALLDFPNIKLPTLGNNSYNTFTNYLTEIANNGIGYDGLGHTALFAPYLVDLEDNTVSPSAAVAGIAMARYAKEGLQQPPAGVKYALRGVKGVNYKFTQVHQTALNPQGLNLIRILHGYGPVVWGSRSLSKNPYYKFINTRIIFSVLNRTLAGAFDGDIFSAIDGQNILMGRIAETARQICHRLWQAGAFFGNTPQEAFLCVCDLTNNTALDLEDGNLRLDVFAAPVPTLEKLLVYSTRVPLGYLAALSATTQESTVTPVEVPPNDQ